jgi:hypothetical protein
VLLLVIYIQSFFFFFFRVLLVWDVADAFCSAAFGLSTPALEVAISTYQNAGQC